MVDKTSKKEHTGLIKRKRMYAEYLQNRDKYPLPFDAYEIHNKDFNKKNNHIINLKILTPKEHDRLHEEHNAGLRRAAEKIEERLDKIKEIQKERNRKNKKKKIISILAVMAIVGILILLLFLFKSPQNESHSLGYITIGNSYYYPQDISTLEKATETCGLRCQKPANSVETNFPLHFITCYCEDGKYFVDTRTLEDLTSQEIANREKTQTG
jgi:hypothetical protein